MRWTVFSFPTLVRSPPYPFQVTKSTLKSSSTCRVVQRPALSEYRQTLAAEYVDGKRIRRENDIKWRRDESMDLYAAELLELHAGSLELEAQGDSLAVGAHSSNGLVEHFGEGVFVEYNTVAWMWTLGSIQRPSRVQKHMQ